MTGTASGDNGTSFANANITTGDGVDTVTITNAGTGTLTYGTVTFAGTAADDIQTLNLVGGSSTDTKLTAGTLTVVNNAATSNLSLSGNVEIGAVTNVLDKVTLKSNAVAGCADLSIAGGELVVGIADDSTHGKLTTSGTVTLDTDSTVTVDVSGYVSDGKAFTVVDGTTAGLSVAQAAALSVSDNSAVLSFAASAAALNTDIVLTASRTSYNSIVTSSSTASSGAKGASESLDGVVTTATGETRELLDTIDELSSAAEVETAMEALSAESQATTVATSMAAVGAYNGGMASRTSQMRTAMATANSPFGPAGPTAMANSGWSAWANGFGTWGDQDGRKGFDGYEWDTYGGMVGIDKVVGNYVFGLSTGYSNTDVDNDGVSDAETETETFHLGLYGTYSQDKWYLDAGMSYAHNWNDGKRKVAFTGFNRTAKSDYDADSYSFYFGGGYDFGTGNWSLVPNATLAYTYYDQDGYSEKNAAGANLTVKDYDQDSFTSTLGLNVGYTFNETVRATFRTAWVHDYCDTQSEVKSKVGAGKYVKTKGFDVDEDTFVFGCGLNAQLDENISAYLDYDYEIKDEFDSHNVTAGVRVDF
jgi:outer membrane autotransporter protein